MSQPIHGISGFFVRVLATLLLVNLTTIGVLLYQAYTFNIETLTRHTQQNITQQVTVVGDRFEEEYGKMTSVILHRLTVSPLLDDYLLGSEAERLVLRRRIELEFRQAQAQPGYMAMLFVDDAGIIQAGIVDGRRAPSLGLDTVSNDPAITSALTQLQSRLASTPLLLSSGNMEWFMPPRQMQVVGPVTLQDGRPVLFAGLARLDNDTGLFGGAILIQIDLQPWLDELDDLRFLGTQSVWVVTPEWQVVLQPPADTNRLDPTPYLAAGPPLQIPPPGQILAQEATFPDLGTTRAMQTDAGLLSWRDLNLAPSDPLLRLVVSIPTDQVHTGFRPAIRFFSVVLAISVGLLILVSYIISRYLSGPVLALAKARNQLANAQRIARLGHWEWDPGADQVVLSEQAAEILCLPSPNRTLSLEAFVALAPEVKRKHLRNLLVSAHQQGRSRALEHRLSNGDGDRHIRQTVEAIDGTQQRVIGTVQDITERKQAEAKIEQLAYSDNVTGLANRALLIEMTNQAIGEADDQGTLAAILFLDLDRFKQVNDTLGHDAGDNLLREVGKRLHRCVRGTDMVATAAPSSATPDTHAVARLGGDEFIVLLRELHEREGALRVAGAIRDALAEPVEVAGKTIVVTGSLGLSLYPEHGTTVDELLKHADAAMYHAKAKGRDRFEMYTASIGLAARTRLSMESRLRCALARQEFRVVYQPRIDLCNDRIVGFEALVRWLDPEIGMITPDQFIPLAEENGLIVPIGHWVMETAINQLGAWRDRTRAQINMSINLSPAQFRDPDLAATVCALIDQAGISPSQVELELTEGTLFHDVDIGVGQAHDIQAAGVRLAVDDFGTGYSSLQLLRRFPVNVLKIDQSFVADVLTDREDALIVRTSVALGQGLGLRVVAEGVETAGQLDFVRAIGCDEAQGYLLGSPMPADQALALLQDQAGIQAPAEPAIN